MIHWATPVSAGHGLLHNQQWPPTVMGWKSRLIWSSQILLVTFKGVLSLHMLLFTVFIPTREAKHDVQASKHTVKVRSRAHRTFPPSCVMALTALPLCKALKATVPKRFWMTKSAWNIILRKKRLDDAETAKGLNLYQFPCKVWKKHQRTYSLTEAVNKHLSEWAKVAAEMEIDLKKKKVKVPCLGAVRTDQKHWE